MEKHGVAVPTTGYLPTLIVCIELPPTPRLGVTGQLNTAKPGSLSESEGAFETAYPFARILVFVALHVPISIKAHDRVDVRRLHALISVPVIGIFRRKRSLLLPFLKACFQDS